MSAFNILTSALSMLALMLVSYSSGATTSTTRQTTTAAATTVDHSLPSQAISYRDKNMETNTGIYGGTAAMGR